MSAVIREGLIYQDIRMDKDALYTLLLTTGYLTAVWRQDIPNGMLCQLKIPNEEVRHVFQSEILDRFCADGDVSRFGIPPAGIHQVWKYGIAFCGKKILAFQGPMC